MTSRTRTAPTPARAIPDAPPANILIPPQQTVEHAHDEERVRARAHELWEAAGRPEGDGVEFWYQAERELNAG